MTILEIIENEIKSFLIENDYRGEHSAPSSEDSPMYDLSGTYPDDIYSGDAARAYKHYGDSRDNQAIYTIQSARNKPNKQIKIYRAVPDININIKSKLKPLYDIINYYNKWNFFPLKNQIVYSLEDKYGDLEYNERQKQVINDLKTQIQALESQINKGLTINNGDWVTISRDYAKEHGDGNLKNYKIISKTVPARNLYSDGNDIFEWGYYVK
jgi:hypothetical protein